MNILPGKFLRWLYISKRLGYNPKTSWLFAVPDKHGVSFPWKGDEVIWSWPWRHRHLKERFISIGFSGTGEFGDARFPSLKAIDDMWIEYYKACESAAQFDNSRLLGNGPPDDDPYAG